MSELEDTNRAEPRRAPTTAPRHAGVLFAVAIGGALGAPARYAVAQLIPVTPGTFPWATFWTNISGAFVLGFFLTVVLEHLPPTRFVRPFFGIGFLGAYTTYSTFAVETAKLVKDGHVALGIGYTVASIVVGVTVAYLGIRLGRVFAGAPVRVPTIDEELEG